MPNQAPDESPILSRNYRLSDRDMADLERIARHYELEWGGIPSRTEAIRLLIRAEIARLDWLEPITPPPKKSEK